MIEAGLGGRYDATNVIPSKVQVLTSVGLEHTRWLGPTIADIAAEKLDVVQPGATLVLGPGLHPDAEAVAQAVAEERGARIVRAPADPGVARRRARPLPARELLGRDQRGRGRTSASSTPMPSRAPPPRCASPAACRCSPSGR